MRPTMMIVALAGAVAASPAAAQTTRRGTAPSPLVAALVNVQATGVLALTTNNAQQQIEVEVGPIPGEVRVFGISGIPDGVPFTNVAAIDLRTGTAQDFVQFRIFSAEAPTINLNTGAGNSDVKFIYFTPAGLTPASSSVTVTGGAAENKVGFEVFNEADSFDANWAVTHGDGNSEVTAAVTSTVATSLLAVDLRTSSGRGQDKAELAITSAAAMLDVAFSPRTGAGNDSTLLTIDGLEPGTASLFFDSNLGDGFDVAEAIAVTRGGTATYSGRIVGGNGDDQAKLLLEGDGRSTLTMNGGNGNDVLDMEYKGAVRGAPRLLGGAGNDILKIVATEPALMNPLLDGGAGFDEAIGFGRIINVENIN